MCNEVYENTHIERVNDTIKNQYLYRKEINNKRQLEAQLAATIKAYNETRPHHSLGKMSPIEYENYLLKVTVEKRTKIAEQNNFFENLSLKDFDIKNKKKHI